MQHGSSAENTGEDNKKMSVNSKPYACSKCGNTFSQKGHMLYHEKTCTQERNECPKITWKVYECDVCEKAFMTQRLLDIHHRKHTGEKPY
jgi:KRAB domain-containing zinc finger protein